MFFFCFDSSGNYKIKANIGISWQNMSIFFKYSFITLNSITTKLCEEKFKSDITENKRNLTIMKENVINRNRVS